METAIVPEEGAILKEKLLKPVKVNKPQPSSGNGKIETSEITIKEFLDFLKTAYQVQENIEGILKDEGHTEIVDWLELKQNNLVKPKDIAVQTSESKLNVDNNNQNNIQKKQLNFEVNVNNESTEIKRKLSEILSEGILDSVLSFLVPQNVSNIQRRSSIAKMQGCSVANQENQEKIPEKLSKSKSMDTLLPTLKQNKLALPIKAESEVEIHVHDEIKNVKKDFVCNQKLLVQQMGYFADVTAGQKLEDMDISVHCDIGIFEWLMNWVKKDGATHENEKTEKPQLDVNCAVPVLVSAAFLQMEPLTDECLRFCHENMNEILRTNTSMSCLNDAILSRLAAMYTNAEVEDIKDRKDKIQSKLFCKLIQAICEPEAESLRGHFCTMGRVYKCKDCHQLINPLIEDYLPCIPSRTRLELDGVIISRHTRDPNWNITDYIATLHSQLKTWRKVYWRVWGDAHFLYCVVCKKYFPAKQLGWCRYHPDQAQYFTVDAQRAPLPVGRYPCCGERAYRFQLLEDCTGCKFKDHEVCTKESRDGLVLAMVENYRGLIVEEPPELMFPERLTRLVARDNSNEEDGILECKEAMWWEGIEIVPQRPKLGMFGLLDEENDDSFDSIHSEAESLSDSSITTSSTSSSSSGSPGSEEYVITNSNTNKKLVKSTQKKRATKTKKKESRLWQHKLSARSNQDLQRTYEEIALKDISCLLARKIATTSEVHSTSKNYGKNFARYCTPSGGIWVRLESEFKDNNAKYKTMGAKPKNKYR